MNSVRIVSRLLVAGALLPAAALGAREGRPGGPGAVYTLSNSAAGNEVLTFLRNPDGTLAASGSTASGGLGTGTSLASQGAVVLTEDHRWLLAVNAGSDSISSFAVTPRGLVLADTTPSGGTTPVSIGVRGQLVYVLNQGGSGNISGFWMGWRGDLHGIPGSTRALSGAGAGAAEVAFAPDGRSVVVTEKATGLLDVYRLTGLGLLSAPASFPSIGAVPYGFTFTGGDEFLVTEAGTNSVSSYDLDGAAPSAVSPGVPSGGAAPCWIAATPDGRYAYASNAHVGTIAGFRVSREGSLAFLGLTDTGSIPLLDLSEAGGYLYGLAAGTQQILGYRINADGSLAPVGAAPGLPPTAQGLAAR